MTEMEQWLTYSLISCFFFAWKAVTQKIASRTINSNTSTLLQLPIRVIATILISFLRTLPPSPPASSPTLKPPPRTLLSLPLLLTRTILSLPQTLLSILRYTLDLPLLGVLFTVLSCVSTVLGGFYYGDALDVGGSGSAVAVVAGCNPALGYVLGVVVGLEELCWLKVLGVVLAVGSCACFAVGGKE